MIATIRGRVIVLCVGLFFYASTTSAATLALRFGKVVDGTGAAIADAVVIVENDRVKTVGPALAVLHLWACIAHTD